MTNEIRTFQANLPANERKTSPVAIGLTGVASVALLGGVLAVANVSTDKFDNILDIHQEGMRHPYTVETAEPQTQHVGQVSGEEIVIADIDEEAMIDSAQVLQVNRKSAAAQLFDSIVKGDNTKGTVFYTVDGGETVLYAAIQKGFDYSDPMPN